MCIRDSALMSRCGLEPERYFDHEDFMAIFDFNTPSTIGALGTAVSQLGQQVLRQIGVTVRNEEREANQETVSYTHLFHDDKNPSMKVDQRFHCFGCGADGDVIDFTAKPVSYTHLRKVWAVWF